MNTIQTDFETMLMTGTKTAFKFAKPYFLNTFEWYAEEEYNELCSLINKTIDDIVMLPFLTIANQRKVEVLECMLQYVKDNKPNFQSKICIPTEQISNVLRNIGNEPTPNAMQAKSQKCTHGKLLNLIKDYQQQINGLQEQMNTLQDKLEILQYFLEGGDCQCKCKD